MPFVYLSVSTDAGLGRAGAHEEGSLAGIGYRLDYHDYNYSRLRWQ